jgi:hypothetical protein
MTIYSQLGGNSVGNMQAIAGTPQVINLTTIAGGGSQNGTGTIMSSDYWIVNTADATNLAVTLPDPNKYGGTAGDTFTLVNGASGQTLKLYPPTGGNISGAGSNTNISITTSKTTQVRLVSYTATTSVWTSMVGA